MAWSKSTRISIMLAIDVAFFFLELGSGIYVGSLALMADAFHMLNDVISLVVGLWAVRVAQKATTDKFSYGWLRAEILGAFFNAVFLIALCVSILLEAFTRFIDPPEIKSPQLILVVGCLGLLSNGVGFFVLGGHSHSHGHEHDEESSHAHQGHDHHDHGIGHVHGNGHGLGNGASPGADNGHGRASHDSIREAEEGRLGDRCGSRASVRSKGHHRRRASSGRVGGLFANIEDLSIHPASFRQEIIAASRPQDASASSDDSGSEDNGDEGSNARDDRDDDAATENTPLAREGPKGHKSGNAGYGAMSDGAGRRASSRSRRPRRDSDLHDHHNHNKPPKSQKGHGGHGHSHDDLGMQAMVLHVIGDALGNVGVIATALIIWKTSWEGRFYADPAVSLFITLIILRSAVPLTLATAKILLQATPDHIDVNDIKADIQDLPGVLSCHHVHIWQLSDTKIVASMHVQVAFPISDEGGERYMRLARRARGCLHAYGIHSATIQPEFCPDASLDLRQQADLQDQADGVRSETASACGNGRTDSNSVCLLECVDDCVGKGCCSGPSSPPGTSHSHDPHHDH